MALWHRSILKAGKKKRGKLSKLEGNVSNYQQENGERSDRRKEPVRLCLEPVGPVGDSGTWWALGSLQSLLHLQESGSKAVGVGWPTPVWSCPQRARGYRSLAPRMDCLVLGLPGDLNHERILSFHPNPTRLVQAMRNHAALPKGRAQSSGRTRLVGSSHSVISPRTRFLSLFLFCPPSGIGLIPRLASVWVARWLPPAFVRVLPYSCASPVAQQ